MKTKPDNLPAMPEGAVYLGSGCQFKRIPNFDGWIFNPSFMAAGWQFGPLEGLNWCFHYAAPAGSEIVSLNRKIDAVAEKDNTPVTK